MRGKVARSDRAGATKLVSQTPGAPSTGPAPGSRTHEGCKQLLCVPRYRLHIACNISFSAKTKTMILSGSADCRVIERAARRVSASPALPAVTREGLDELEARVCELDRIASLEHDLIG